jgi:hypothetical protein
MWLTTMRCEQFKTIINVFLFWESISCCARMFYQLHCVFIVKYNTRELK